MSQRGIYLRVFADRFVGFLLGRGSRVSELKGRASRRGYGNGVDSTLTDGGVLSGAWGERWVS